MRNTLLPYTLESIKKIVGVPYTRMNCWDVVQFLYCEWFGISLKKYYESGKVSTEYSTKLISVHTQEFKEVESPEFGDIIVLLVKNVPAHVGVYLNEDKFIHTTKHSGCVIDRLHKWKNLIVGYYRVEND